MVGIGVGVGVWRDMAGSRRRRLAGGDSLCSSADAESIRIDAMLRREYRDGGEGLSKEERVFTNFIPPTRKYI